MSKLSNADVLLLRQMYADKVPLKEIAAKFGIRYQYVWVIANRYVWTHI